MSHVYKVGDRVRYVRNAPDYFTPHGAYLGGEYQVTDVLSGGRLRLNTEGAVTLFLTEEVEPIAPPAQPPGSAYDMAVAAGKAAHDPIAAPAHYTRFAIQPIDFILANNLDFPTGNVIKYVCRWDGKDGLQDLKKARQYLDRMIEKAEKG